MPLSRLLRGHLAEMLKLEERAARALLDLYGELGRELSDRLAGLDAAGRGETFTAQHLGLMASQVRSALSTFGATATRTLRDLTGQAIGLGGRQQLAEITDIERRFGTPQPGRLAGLSMAERAGGLVPQIPAAQVAHFLDPQALLINRFGAGVEVQVGRELAKSMALGEGIPQAARRLRGQVEGKDWELERIARTEINHGANLGHHGALAQANESIPGLGLKKQWSAHLDQRVCKVCRSLHLQVREVNEEFEASNGWRGLHAPCHPNDRCRVLPYSERWEDRSRRRRTERETLGRDLNPVEGLQRTPRDVAEAGRREQRRRANSSAEERRNATLRPDPP